MTAALVPTVIVAAHVHFTLCTYICILGHKHPGPGIVLYDHDMYVHFY